MAWRAKPHLITATQDLGLKSSSVYLSSWDLTKSCLIFDTSWGVLDLLVL